MKSVRANHASALVGMCAAIVCFMLLFTGCVESSKKMSGGDKADRPFQIRYFTANPFTGPQLSQNLATGMNRLRLSDSVTTALDAESLWALSQCKCSPGFASTYAQLLAQSRGALPSPLVPAVREEVRNNPALKALLSLPPGVQDLAGVLAGLFVKDETIAAEIQKSIDEKLAKALGQTTKLSDRLKYNFNLYPSPFVNLGDESSFSPKNVNISAQASKWAFVFALDNMWSSNNSQPLALDDHSLQLLITAISVQEWTYAFGLDPSSSGTTYGGITFDPRQGVTAPLLPADPRKNPNAAGVISGNYSISFPSNGTLKLATTVKEQWTRNSETIPLDEQARIWTAAAEAYGRLKPSARHGQISQIFAPSTGMFPDDVHSLPLAMLPGMSALLDTPFIVEGTREIRGAASISGANPAVVNARAGLKTLARMSRALQVWTIQTDTVAQDRLSPDITQMITQSRSRIKDGMRLAVQTIIDNHTANEVPSSRLGGSAMVQSKQDFSRPPLAEVAEALAVIADIDQTTLHGQPGVQTDLNKKIVALYHWFAAEYLTDIASGNLNQELRPESVLWTYKALKVFSRYPPQISQAPWLSDALKGAETAVTSWDLKI